MEIMLSHLGVGMAYSAANSSSALHGEAFVCQCRDISCACLCMECRRGARQKTRVFSRKAIKLWSFLYAENHSLGEWFQKDFIGE